MLKHHHRISLFHSLSLSLSLSHPHSYPSRAEQTKNSQTEAILHSNRNERKLQSVKREMQKTCTNTSQQITECVKMCDRQTTGTCTQWPRDCRKSVYCFGRLCLCAVLAAAACRFANEPIHRQCFRVWVFECGIE